MALTKVASLDLYRPDDPFRVPARSEFRDRTDVLEFATMCTAGFPEPRTFGRRLASALRPRSAEFDILHDNQTLAPGILAASRAGLPLVTTVHHPISADRRAALAEAGLARKITVARWYGFVGMQRRVARRLEHLIAVSDLAADDIAADFGVRRDRLRVIGAGVDTARFAPAATPRSPGMLVAVVSSDVAIKGLPVLLRAFAALTDASLVVVGAPGRATTELIGELGIGDRIRFVRDLAEQDLVALIASAELLVVPSLYEGFSIPALEAIACATPVVGSRVGALPALCGERGERGLLVSPGDVGALTAAIDSLLKNPSRRFDMGRAGRELAVRHHSWAAVAAQTADYYAEIIDARRPRRGASTPRDGGVAA